MNALNRLNFNDVLNLDVDVDKYDFDVYIKNDKHLIKGFCTRCEEKGFNICPTDSTYKLQNISHGATTQDVLLATNQINLDFTSWKHDSVMFLMEGPSVDWGFYEINEVNGYVKKPTKDWYWVHDKQDRQSYPQEFKGGRYGSLFNSIIFTFELKNAYLTNLVKCGLNSPDNRYKGIKEYDYNCLQTCVKNILLKEIDILQPKIVFCFGSNVESYFEDLYPDDYPFLVVGLPHPAGQRRGFKNEFYRHLYFTRILEGLFLAGIMTLSEAKDKFETFLTIR